MPSIPKQSVSRSSPPVRRFLTRAEAATLIGMVVVVFSLFLTWDRPLYTSLAAIQATAPYVGSLKVERSGFSARVFGPLTVCATLCASTLLWDANAKNRLALAAVQGAGALACLVVALTHFALTPGVLVALAGSGLLLFGAVDRFTQAAPAPAQE